MGDRCYDPRREATKLRPPFEFEHKPLGWIINLSFSKVKGFILKINGVDF